MHCNLRPPDLALNYEAHNALAYKFKFRNLRDVSTVGEHLTVFWPNLYCACVQNPDIDAGFGD